MQKAHGRIEHRIIDVLPIEATGLEKEWPTAQQVCRVRRIIQRKKKGVWPKPKEEIAYLITSLSADKASPQDLLTFNRSHWGIEIMHRNKDVFLGEDTLTSRKDKAPHALFILNNIVLALLKTVSHSPTKAIETLQDNRNLAIRLLS
ncbi:MAG: transposase [Patescibacteria group bacterium]|nr:transposase [Patescibacteria group bacterium]